MENRLSERIDDIEQNVRQDIADVKSQVNTLEHRVIMLDKTIRIVDQNVSVALSNLRIDVELVKGELNKQQ